MALRGLPHEERLLDIVRRALAKRKRERYPSAGRMLRDLDAYCRDAAIDISAVDLASWLAHAIGSERVAAERRRTHAHAAAIEHRDSIYGADPLPESGVRLIDQRADEASITTSERVVIGTRTALVACAVTFAIFYLLTVAGYV